jgi:hypothetical protein
MLFSMLTAPVAAGVVSCYVHMPVAPGAGRIAAMVGLEAAGAQQLAQVRLCCRESCRSVVVPGATTFLQ